MGVTLTQVGKHPTEMREFTSGQRLNAALCRVSYLEAEKLSTALTNYISTVFPFPFLRFNYF